MSTASLRFDWVIVGAGPAGQKAAVQAAKAGERVLIVDREPHMGGACVQHGTIPSKTLRETALALVGLRRRCGGALQVDVGEDVTVASLMARKREVVRAHNEYMARQLERNGIACWHGRARFVDPHTVEVTARSGTVTRATATNVLIATGSRPRTPPDVPVDHEHILDSDSFLSMAYLPRSLTVLGGGVIASEYASIFASLGVRVVMVDRAPLPVSFLDKEIVDRFVSSFEASGSRFVGGRKSVRVEFDGISTVHTELDDGEVIASDKVLCALGRVANVEGLGLEALGVGLSSRGVVEVDEHLRTAVPHIYAAGDVIGPPSLASASMEQGRRVVCHALGMPIRDGGETNVVGVYTLPEMASVGMTEAQAIETYGRALVGRAELHEVARGQIAATEEGLLKLVADGEGQRVVGVQVVGEGAAELVHVGQMAILGKMAPDTFIDNVFNFPTLAEAYRVAALDIAGQRAAAINLRPRRHRAGPPSVGRLPAVGGQPRRT